MDAPQCLLRFRQDERTLTVQIEGRGTMRQAPGLRRLADCGHVAGISQIFLDLGRCTFMDSTFIGSFLCMRRQFGEAGLMLVRPSAACREHLRQIGLLDVLPIRETLPVPDAGWTTLTDAEGDVGQFRNSVVQAHEALACLPGGSGEHFRSVADCLAAETAARK